MLHAGPPQHTRSVHDGVIIADNDKSSHTQSRTTASTNSLLKGSRKKTGIDSVCFVYVCLCHVYVCVQDVSTLVPSQRDHIFPKMMTAYILLPVPD